MYGAILGDIVGSPYEFDCNNYKAKDFPLFSRHSDFTDDTVMALAVATREQPPAWPLMPVPTLAWLYLVVFGSIVAFCAYMYLLAHASAAVATSYAFVNPVIALLLGVAIGAERVTPWEWTATGVVLAGVVLIFLGKRAVGRGKT